MNQLDKQVPAGSRRNFLKVLGTGAAAGTALSPMLATAAGTGDWRALVCVFLYGGNDGINMVPPVQAQAWSRYQAVRGALAMPAGRVIDLNGQLGLHGAMHPLKAHWDSGRLAVVNNVGVLSRPTTQAEYFRWSQATDNNYVPDSLFSHSDQQTLWEAGHADILTRTGWGGRLMEALAGSKPVYSFGRSSSRFGQGDLIQQLTMPVAGNQLGLEGFDGSNPWTNARFNALQELASQGNANLLQTTFAHSQFSAFETSALLGDMLAQAPTSGAADAANPEISQAFGHFSGGSDNDLSRQLYQVAKMIKNRATVGGNRHLYFVALEGFDHHANQMQRQDELLGVLGNAMAGFQQAMNVLGVADQVTLFTESDFGRTFKPNSSGGTDHGWGNQQLVMGGAVSGGRGHGDYPSLELGGPDDAGENAWEQQGRWIPQYSVEQYAATLTKWFAPELGSSMDRVLPNLARFSRQDLGFMV